LNTIASETVHGLSQQDSKKQGKQSKSRVYHNESKNNQKESAVYAKVPMEYGSVKVLKHCM